MTPKHQRYLNELVRADIVGRVDDMEKVMSAIKARLEDMNLRLDRYIEYNVDGMGDIEV